MEWIPWIDQHHLHKPIHQKLKEKNSFSEANKETNGFFNFFIFTWNLFLNRATTTTLRQPRIHNNTATSLGFILQQSHTRIQKQTELNHKNGRRRRKRNNTLLKEVEERKGIPAKTASIRWILIRFLGIYLD